MSYVILEITVRVNRACRFCIALSIALNTFVHFATNVSLDEGNLICFIISYVILEISVSKTEFADFALRFNCTMTRPVVCTRWKRWPITLLSDGRLLFNVCPDIFLVMPYNYIDLCRFHNCVQFGPIVQQYKWYCLFSELFYHFLISRIAFRYRWLLEGDTFRLDISFHLYVKVRNPWTLILRIGAN